MLVSAPKNKKIKNNQVLRLASVMALVLVSVTYIWHTSQVSTQGYYLKDLERRVVFLEKREEQLEFEAASYQSLSRIETAVADLDMVKNNKIIYMDQGAGVFALSK